MSHIVTNHIRPVDGVTNCILAKLRLVWFNLSIVLAHPMSHIVTNHIRRVDRVTNRILAKLRLVWFNLSIALAHHVR